MPQPSRVRRLALFTVLAAAGCQDYNFNPVGHCVVQPGAARVTLSDIKTADVLFVVDDSGSMQGEQQKLKDNFKVFIDNLDAFNAARTAEGVEAIEFHVAVTTTSVFLNNQSAALCRADCPGAAAGNVCCRMENSTPVGPLFQVKRCDPAVPSACGTAGDTCTDACAGYLGEAVCCSAAGRPVKTDPVACANVGAACGDLQTHYIVDASCKAGNAVDGEYYPHGAFIGSGNNPRVLHFDKLLYPPPTDPCVAAHTCKNAQGFTSADLRGFFEENVFAGTCGSGQEQALRASRLAVEKALTSAQLDFYAADSGTLAPGTKAIWPHDRSKLVLVYVGDEDDCSSPEDASAGIILAGNPGSDSCVHDQSLPAEEQQETPVSAIVGYFTSLKLADKTPRPLGAAFIVSTQGTCQDETCSPGICCDTACTGDLNVCSNATCGGQAPGRRLLDAAAQFRANGDVVVGSICDEFGPILNRIADIVKPPTALTLPTEPAASQVTVLRIAGTNGKTRKTCSVPAPAGMSLADALAGNYDWWFTADRAQETELQKTPTASTRYIYINHLTHNCEASPGETYSADYLGRLPAGGCVGATARAADDACVAGLGGRGYSDDAAQDGDWTCYAGLEATTGKCQVPTAQNPGTCICGKRGAASATVDAPVDGNCPVGSAF